MRLVIEFINANKLFAVWCDLYDCV